MRKFLVSFAIFFLFYIILIASVDAQDAITQTTQTQAYIYVTIINPSPELENLTITSPAYTYSKIECKADVIDNNPASVILHYKWYVDGELISEEESISGIEAEKEVRCEVTAYDSAGQASNTATASTVIQSLNVFGVTAYAIKSLGNTSATAVNLILLLVASLIILQRLKIRK